MNHVFACFWRFLGKAKLSCPLPEFSLPHLQAEQRVQKNPGQLAGKQPRSRHSSPNRSRSPSTPRRASPQAGSDGNSMKFQPGSPHWTCVLLQAHESCFWRFLGKAKLSCPLPEFVLPHLQAEQRVQKNPGQLAGKQPRSRHSSPNRSRSPSTPRRASPQAGSDGNSMKFQQCSPH